VKVEKIGQSEEGRNVWLLRISDSSTAPRIPAFIRARVHAYESAGSYAMEGMVRWLLSEDDWAISTLRRYAVHVLPMANPDGVFNGLGRLTKPQGADLTWAVTPRPDRAHAVGRQAVDRVRPKVYVDLHNWQNKHQDGLLGLDPKIRERFLHYMPDQLQFGKRWSIREPMVIGSVKPEQETMGLYCRRAFEAVGVAFEFPWFGRKPDDVRQTGAKAIRALFLALGEADSTR
jgi:hypothetical protein